MLVAKRVFAAVALMLGTVGLLVSLAGGVGVWFIREPVTARATRIFDRIESACDSAERHLEEARASLTHAAERLDSAGEEQRKISQEPPSSKLRRGLARTVQQRLSPKIDEACEKLHAVTEAAVVVNSVLQDVGNIPFLSEAGLDMDGLKRLTKRVAEMRPAVLELSRLVGDPEPDADAGAQFNRIDQALQNVQRELAEYEQRVREARQRAESLESRTLAWIPLAAVLLSAVCFWMALSQVSVLFHVWSWWKDSRHAPAADPGGPR